jgi:hypothetical protein
MTHSTHPPHHAPSLLQILGWLLLALVLGVVAIALDGCVHPGAFRAPVIGRPLPVPHSKVGKR